MHSNMLLRVYLKFQVIFFDRRLDNGHAHEMRALLLSTR